MLDSEWTKCEITKKNKEECEEEEEKKKKNKNKIKHKTHYLLKSCDFSWSLIMSQYRFNNAATILV